LLHQKVKTALHRIESLPVLQELTVFESALIADQDIDKAFIVHQQALLLGIGS